MGHEDIEKNSWQLLKTDVFTQPVNLGEQFGERLIGLTSADGLHGLVLLSQKVAVSAPVESVFVEIHISLEAEMNHRRTDESESQGAAGREHAATASIG